MYSLMICIATAAVGIDVGWERLPEGGVEYIIQLDPQTLESLGPGKAVQSDIPPSAGDVRSFRIVVGSQKLPREAPLAPPPTPKTVEPKAPTRGTTSLAAPQALPPDLSGKPLPGRRTVYDEPEVSPMAGKPQPKATPEVQPEKPAVPWLPLIFTIFGLFASLGANVYLFWIAWEYRQRYLARLELG